jgi:glycosyltransferase involved in cell wall biosynthesis
MTPTGSPTVSVVLRTYDHEPFIAQAIESVLIQRAGFPFELVIAEDCSTDGTREIVKEYAERTPQLIKAVLPERNLGHGEIFRLALEAAGGDFIAYLDGDDYWTSTAKLSRQVEFLERNRECASCFHDVSLVYDEAGLPSGSLSPRLAGGRFTLEQILMECFVPAPSMMFRREVAEELPAWVFESAWIDWLIHIRAAERGPLGYIPQALAAYRVHRGGMFSALDRVSQLEEDVHFYERLVPELPEQQHLIERCSAYRRAQLAIERLGVPFDACVVLVDPKREFRPYFNGRHARNLPRREGNEVTELDAIREAAAELPRAVRDYGPAGQTDDGHGGCYVVLQGLDAEWLQGRPELDAYLDAHGEIASQDEWTTIYELAAVGEGESGRASRGARRVDVRMLASGDRLPAAYLDSPISGTLLPGHAISVVGWVVGEDGDANAVEFEAGGEVVWRAPVRIERPDVAAAFPELEVGRPGFQTTLNVQAIPVDTVTAWAVFTDGSRLPVAELSFGGPDDSERDERR